MSFSNIINQIELTHNLLRNSEKIFKEHIENKLALQKAKDERKIHNSKVNFVEARAIKTINFILEEKRK